MKVTTLLPRALALGVTLATCATSAEAAWTQLSLPPLANSFGSYRAEHFSDGLLIYGSNNDLDLQSSFQFTGSVALDDYSAALAWDPSSIALFSNTVGVIGRGTFSPSPIYRFDPTNLATPFTAIPGVSLQNYGIVFRDAAGIYVAGQNGTGGSHSVSYVSLDGMTNKVIIDSVSTYSGDIAIDLAGNLYVSDNDDLKLYRFTPLQLAAAIAGDPLAISAGSLVTATAKNGSLAVDGLGRVWSAGYQSAGLDMFDPLTGATSTFIPNLNNTEYIVTTFGTGPDAYVGYINASGSAPGATLTYGFEKAVDLVPEPGTASLLIAGVLGLAARRRRRS